MLQVQVVVLFEDGGAEEFESFPLLNRALQLSVELLADHQLLLALRVDRGQLLHRLQGRVLHDLGDLVRERLETLGIGAQAWTAIEEVVPLVEVLAHLLVKLLLLLFFEFRLQLGNLLRPVKRLVKRNLVILEAVQDALIHFFLLISVLLGPFFRCLLHLLFSWGGLLTGLAGQVFLPTFARTYLGLSVSRCALLLLVFLVSALASSTLRWILWLRLCGCLGILLCRLLRASTCRDLCLLGGRGILVLVTVLVLSHVSMITLLSLLCCRLMVDLETFV